jgi:hypothetical protein
MLKRRIKTALFTQSPTKVWHQDWVVHCKPVGNGRTALKYLAPYVFRVAISNSPYPLKTSPPVFMLEIGNPALFSIVGKMNYLLHMEHKTDGLVHPQAHFLT